MSADVDMAKPNRDAILLNAHFDSVPQGPGASDDGVRSCDKKLFIILFRLLFSQRKVLLNFLKFDYKFRLLLLINRFECSLKVHSFNQYRYVLWIRNDLFWIRILIRIQISILEIILKKNLQPTDFFYFTL